jgi:phenylalanine-4-hydroxylase
LLSSIGESVSCLESHVKKIPYSVDAQHQAFDITTKQPQLFVCRDFQHLMDVLEDFADTMAYRRGGLEGINKAIECNRVATCEYSSGLQVTGVFDEVLVDEDGKPIYLHATGPCALAYKNKQIEGHGREHHAEGFGSPIGRYRPNKLKVGQTTTLQFDSGITVAGRVNHVLERDGKTLLVSFSSCTAKYQDRILFDPSWGTFDMAVGERISSVFNGAADKDAFLEVALVPKERTIKAPSDEERRRLESLYQQVRDIRETRKGYERLGEIWETQQAEHPGDWLLSMNIYEVLDDTGLQPELKDRISAFLRRTAVADKEKATLIEWGFRLVTYHKMPESRALVDRAAAAH